LKGVKVPVASNAKIAADVKIYHPDLVNLYGCTIGAGTRIGAFVEVQIGAIIGERCKISSHSFLCEGVTLEDEVFIGHGVIFTNDRFPRATNDDGNPQTTADWVVIPTRVKQCASIGSGTVILPGIVIGRSALIGAGSVVTKDVPDFAIVAGNPARMMGDIRNTSKQRVRLS
jgi:acetyltransferase-like isoleucine patch superfamily enzyme